MNEFKLTEQQIKDIIYFYEGSQYENEVITDSVKLNHLEMLSKKELKEFSLALEIEMSRFTNPGEADGYTPEEITELCRWQDSIERLLDTVSENSFSTKQRLFVDMDGTMAQFKTLDTLEPLFEKGYFENLAPQMNVVNAVKEITQKHKNIEVYILSAYLYDSKYALDEKNKWLDKYIPEIDADHRVFCPCGVDKKDYVICGIRHDDFLLDDYTANLNLWQPPAKGIKLLNGINNTKGTWEYDKLSFQKDANALANDIVSIMHGEATIKDSIANDKYIYIEVTSEQLTSLQKSDINFTSKNCDSKLIVQITSSDVSRVEQLFGNRNNKTL